MQGETEMPRPAMGMKEVQGAEDAVTTDGGGGREVGEGLKREGTHVYLMFTLMYGRNQHIIVMCCNSN